MSQNDIDATYVEETFVVTPLQRSPSPSMDTYDAFDERDEHVDHQRMFMLDVSAIIVGTIMALGPLSVYSIFGS